MKSTSLYKNKLAMLLVTVMVVGTALATVTTLTQDVNFPRFIIELVRNSANSSNTDLIFTYRGSDTFPSASNWQTIYCVNPGNDNYTLTSGQTGLSAFSIEFQCDATCTAASNLFAGSAPTYLVTDTASYTTNQVTTAAMTAPSGFTFTTTANNSDLTAVATASGLTDTQLADAKMPNATSSIPYVCISGTDNGASAGLNAGAVADVDTALAIDTSANVTIFGSNAMGVAAITAAAGTAILALV